MEIKATLMETPGWLTIEGKLVQIFMSLHELLELYLLSWDEGRVFYISTEPPQREWWFRLEQQRESQLGWVYETHLSDECIICEDGLKGLFGYIPERLYCSKIKSGGGK